MLTATTAETNDTVSRPPSVHVIVRRRRVLGVLAGAAAGCALLAWAGFTALWALTVLFVTLAAGYLALVARMRHLRDRREMDLAFGSYRHQADTFDWHALERDLQLAMATEDPALAAPPQSVEVDNRAIGRFLVCWALGWILTPIVTVMGLFRGGGSLMGQRIVKWQQYGRSQSLRLLTVGAAASVGITAVSGLTASVGASPTVAVVSTTTHSAGAPRSYTVVPNDTLYSIARRSGTTVGALAAANHLANPNFILPGQILSITGPIPEAALTAATRGSTTTYTIRRGDTMYAIARAHGTTAAALAHDNGISNPSRIFPGQVLTVPVAPAQAPVVAAATARVAPAPAGATAKVPASSTPAAPAPARAATPAPAPAPALAKAPAPAPIAAKVTSAAAAAPAATLSALPLPAQYLHGAYVDQGVDYSAPGGTPLYAMGPGKIIRAGMSGFGPNCPVLEITAGPLAGKTIYYGHAGANLVSVGDTVAAGQQISVVGYGIVGYSTGPHLEVGFYPPGGNGSGGAMLNYLNGAVGHSTS